MTAAELIETDISEIVGLDHLELAHRYRGTCVRLVIVRYRVIETVSIVCIAPLGHCWEFAPPSGLLGIEEWQRALPDAISASAVAREMRASRLPRKSLVNGLLDFGNADALLHPDRYLNSWFHVWSVPPARVGEAFVAIEDWVAQLGDRALAQMPDEATADPRWGLVTRMQTERADNDLFCSFWSAHALQSWRGQGGRLERLLEHIVSIETDRTHSLRIDPSFRSSVRFPDINRHHLKNLAGLRRWRDQLPDGDVRRESVSTENLDRLFSAYARLTRLLDWPILYPSAIDVLSTEASLLAQAPLFADLRWNPRHEIDAYAASMRARFPILARL